MENHPNEIVFQQPSKFGGILTILGLGAGAAITFVVVRKIQKGKELRKVEFDKKKIPNYTKAQLIEFRDKCCTGGAPKSGRPSACEKHDVKRVACAWVPKVLNWMNENKVDIFTMWHPDLLSRRLFEEMKGVAVSEFIGDAAKAFLLGPVFWFMPSSETANYNSRTGLFLVISQLSVDQLRWLHNWWVSHHADGDNLYEWIRGEVGVSVDIRNKATGAMDRAGVGSTIVVERNKIA
jgi:hypothetical protein